MARKLFGRRVRVTIKPLATSAKPDWIVVDGHDVAFDVEKNQEIEPNKGRVTIYNLEKKLRDRLQLKDDATVTIEAGYKDTMGVIFTGNITHVLSDIQGPDIITQIDAGESHKAYRGSYHAKSYGAGTPYKTVIEDIVKTFEGFKVTPAITNVISNIGKTVPNALTLDGKSANLLNSVLGPLGLAFSMQQGELQIVEKGKASDLPTVNLTYSSGLVNVPQIGEKKPPAKATISFQSFIQPELIPLRKVFVDWVESKGEFVCVTVKHKGSNFDNEFYSTVEAFLP